MPITLIKLYALVMSMKIESTRFGCVVIDGKEYGDVIISEGRIIERDRRKLHKLFGTSHRISEEEFELLKAGNPEFIIIGTGQYGVLNAEGVDEKLRGFKVLVKKTPEAIKAFNELVSKGKKVNALFHTTC